MANCRFRDDPYSAAIRNDTIAANQKLDNLLGLFADGAIMQKLNGMDAKLGPQLNGGIGGFLRNFSRNSLIQGALNAMNLFTTLHNAMMLSNNIRQTLFSAFDLFYMLPGMQQFAPQDPETGEVLDYGTWASEQMDALLREAFGDQTVDTVRTTWNKASRIYQAAANLLFAMQSLIYSLMELTEAVGKWIAWIGNALKRFGAVTENAFPWMNPNISARRFNRIFNALENAEEQVENIEAVAAASVDVTETVGMLNTQQQEFRNALQQLDADGNPDPSIPTPVYPYAEAIQPVAIAEQEFTSADAGRRTEQPIVAADEQRPPIEEVDP